MDTMTLTASPTVPPSTVAAAVTPAERTHILGSAPPALRLLWDAGRRRIAVGVLDRLSTRALGPTTRGVA